MRRLFTVIAIELVIVLAVLGVATITNPNNNTFTGTTTFNGAIAGAHGQSVGTGDIVTFAIVQAASGFTTSAAGMSLGTSGTGGNSAITCNNSFACLTITGNGLYPAISVVSGTTSVVGIISSGSVTFTGLSSSSGGKAVCIGTSGLATNQLYIASGSSC